MLRAIQSSHIHCNLKVTDAVSLSKPHFARNNESNMTSNEGFTEKHNIAIGFVAWASEQNSGAEALSSCHSGARIDVMLAGLSTEGLTCYCSCFLSNLLQTRLQSVLCCCDDWTSRLPLSASEAEQVGILLAPIIFKELSAVWHI